MVVKREGKGFENGELRGGKKKDQDQTRHQSRPDRRDQTRRSRLGWANKTRQRRHWGPVHFRNSAHGAKSQ